MAFLNPSEWSKAVQMTVGGLATVGTIIGLYLGVEAWAEDRITQSERRVITEIVTQQVRNEIDHDKMIQSQRLSEADTNLRVTELQLEILEDEIAEREESGLEPTERQKRKMDRLLSVVETYETVREQATENLTRITRTTTTTTTTTTEEEN